MPRPLPRQLTFGLVVALLFGGTGALLLTSGSSTASSPIVGGPTPAPAPEAVAVLASAKGDVVPWDKPLTVTVTDGTLTSVTAIGPDGSPFEGTVQPATEPTTWMSTHTLVPGSAYTLHVELRNADGKRSSYDRTVTASTARELRATVSPSNGVYGIGQPVVVRFNKAVTGNEARAAVLTRLSVTTAPAVEGAWRWYNSFEVHYRAEKYWKPGTTVVTTADLRGLRIPGTTMWGATKKASGGMTIGRSLIATVDITAHTMTVVRDGVLVRTMKISAGREEFPTKGGPHIVLKREKVHLFNSATIGIPTASPDGYYVKHPWSVRISNGGAFVHTNAGTVRYQGRVNVSHGCINASPTDAKWFYENSLLGDVVDVVHAAVGPNRSDAGMFDWNYSWDDWKFSSPA